MLWMGSATVSIEAVLPGEEGAALGTLEGLLLGVGADVPLEMVGPQEAASAACERTLMGRLSLPSLLPLSLPTLLPSLRSKIETWAEGLRE